MTHWKRLWCWEGLGAGGKGDDRGWGSWMASPTRWTWVWVNSGRWWWTGRPGILWFMGLQGVGHDWATELNWTELNWYYKPLVYIFLYFFPPVEGKLLESKDFVCTSVPLEPWEKSVSVAWVNVWNHWLIPQRCLIEYYAPETSSNI